MMLSALRKRLRVSPTTVIATLALVFAMTGGAYAAKKYLITSTKQISPSVLKSLQGKAGPAGANGAPGAQGAQGPAAPAGPQGPAGAAGVKGDGGAAGAPGAKGATGPQGSTGVTGAKGTTGFTETLPSGKTETGTWGGLTQVQTTVGERMLIPISFTLPVEPEPTFVFVSKEAPLPPGCPGFANGLPLAEPGKLCVYAGLETEVVFGEATKTVEKNGIRKTSEGAGSVGTVLAFGCESEFGCNVKGAWAVTAE